MTQTISIELRRIWVKLENTERGVLLQREQGEVVFYAYGTYAPHPDSEGMAEDAQGGPTRLRSGDIWVRSRGWSKVAVTPFDVDSEQVDIIVGNIDDLTTPEKENTVEAINWLDANKANKQDLGDKDNLLTPVKSSFVDAINSIEERIDILNTERLYDEDFVITSEMMTSKSLVLPYTPNGIVHLLPYGGIPQQDGVDFITTGNIISWDSLSLEIILEVGETINVQFKRG